MTTPFPTIPGYKILKEMGQGGMAYVYLAVQESFGRQVALKIMSDQLGKDDVWAERFMHEARIVAQLSHSNIVPVFDVGSHAGRFYISMELLKGGKLDEKIAKGLSTAEIIKIVCGVAAGLDYAGSKGFVHRDIKPDNIMFRDDGTPVILDFGIAKQKDGDSKMTKTGTVVGTTGYMSPEQAMAQELDERSDIYSLGIMFYELLTGAVPFRGDSAVAVLLKHVQETPPPLPAHLSAYQPVLDKALAKKPQDRYKRGSEMIEHLQEIQAQSKQNTNTMQTTVLKPVTKQNTSTKTAISKTIETNKATQLSSSVNVPESKRLGKKSVVAIVVMLSVIIFAWTQRAAKETTQQTLPAVSATNNTPTTSASVSAPIQQESQPVVEPAVEPKTETTVIDTATTETKPVAEMENGNQRAIVRIVLGARACLKRHEYDCAKSKAESALDLEPENMAAKKILAAAEKAQKEAFSGDWNAK